MNNKNKELTMNKFTKIGVSALCGSLAGIASANAGALSVSGGADLSWASLSGDVTGNPIGMGSNIGFSGSGELDNGTAVSLSIAYTNKAAYSASNVTLDMPTLGTLIITQGVSGTGIDRYDDKMPTAWEEATGTALGTGIRTVGAVAAGAGIEWTPSMLPEGISARLAYSPRVGGASSNDKKTSGDDGGIGGGFDIIVESSSLMDGLNVFAGMGEIEQSDTASYDGDRSQYTVGATYAIGMVTAGYQYSRDNMQNNGAGAASYYENDIWGVSFNISDDLSLSYGEHESKKSVSGGTDVTTEVESIQIAYSMGGASIRLAEAKGTALKYATGSSNDKDGTTISLSLAF